MFNEESQKETLLVVSELLFIPAYQYQNKISSNPPSSSVIGVAFPSLHTAAQHLSAQLTRQRSLNRHLAAARKELRRCGFGSKWGTQEKACYMNKPKLVVPWWVLFDLQPYLTQLHKQFHLTTTCFLFRGVVVTLPLTAGILRRNSIYFSEKTWCETLHNYIETLKQGETVPRGTKSLRRSLPVARATIQESSKAQRFQQSH